MIDGIGEAVAAVASLAETIFKWATDPEGYRELSVNKKLERLHEASCKALAAKDFAALDTLLREYRRLSDSIV